ncbi:Putative pentatricopeptide repeat-containing protein At5g59900 [Linum perenne]
MLKGILLRPCISRASCLFDCSFIFGGKRSAYSVSSSYVGFESNDESMEKSVFCSEKNVNDEQECKLFPLVATSQVNFAVRYSGFSPSIKMVMEVFASAGFENHVQVLLRDIVSYYQEARLDVSGLCLSLLDSIELVEVVSSVFSVLIKVLAEKKMLEDAFYVFVQARKIGIEPHIRSCNFLLKCLTEAMEIELFMDMFEQLKNSGIQRNVYTYAILMNFYCNTSYLFQEADLVRYLVDELREMDKFGISQTAVTYSTFVRGLCKVGRLEDALEFVQDLRTRNFILNSYSYNAIIHGFCQKGELGEALKVMEEMDKFGIPQTAVTYSTFVRGLCKAGRAEYALVVVRDLKARNCIFGSYCYNDVIHGFCQKGEVGEALKVLEEMKRCGVSPDVFSYSVLIEGCIMSGELDAANECVEEMTMNGVTPSCLTFNRLIHGFYKEGHFKEALKVFCTMRESLVAPNVFTCNLIAAIYCRGEGGLVKALDFLNEMQKLGFIRKSYVYYTCIKLLCRNGMLEKAVENLHANSPDVAHYNVVIHGFAKQLNANGALRWCGEMLNSGLEPTILTYTPLIKMYFGRFKMVKAYGLFQEMRNKGIVPDKIAYTSVIDGFCKIGDVKNAVVLFAQMLRMNHAPDVRVYTSLIHGYCKINRGDMANAVFDKMERAGCLPNVVTYTVLINMYSSGSKMVEAYSLFQEMRKKGVVIDKFAYISITDGFCRIGDMKSADMLYTQMLKTGHGRDLDQLHYSQVHSLINWIYRLQFPD